MKKSLARTGQFVRIIRRKGRAFGLAAVLSVALAACTTNPATGESDFTPFMSPAQEAQIGAQEHPKILEAYGGAYGGPQVGGYVASIGGRLGKNSDLPDLKYTFTVLDSPVVNAFALPGGYVYVTRGLMALANSEAELAGVLAHEIGHVTARHSAKRYNTAIGTSLLGAVIGAAIGSSAANQIINLGSQAFLASYSRDQEYEADSLGVRYLARTGYDPYAQANFLNNMGAQSELHAKISGSGRDPNSVDFFSTHPNTRDRVVAAIENARASGVAMNGMPERRNAYLNAVNGMIYGDSPEQGFVRERTFSHPKLKLTFTVPDGFRMQNSAQAVVAIGPNDSAVKFDGGKVSGNIGIADYLTRVWAKNVRLSNVEKITVNGMPAATGTTRIQGKDVRLVAIKFDSTSIYRFMMVTPPSMTARLADPFRKMTYSFRRLSNAEAAKLKPLRLRVISANGRSAEQLGNMMAFKDYRVERFRVLNGLAPGQNPPANAKVKIVTE